MRKTFDVLRKFGIALIFTAVAGFLQNTNLVNLGDIKPNLTLVVLIALSFFMTNFFYYLILVLVAGIFLKFEAVFELNNLAFTLILFAVYWLERKLPGRPFLNNVLLIAVSTLVFYALVDFTFLNSYPLTVFKEMVYNIILGILVFFISRRFLFHEKGFRASF